LIRADDGTVTTLARVPQDKFEPFVGIFKLPGNDGVLVANAHQMLSIQFLQEGNRFAVRQTDHHPLRSWVTDPYYDHFLDSLGAYVVYGRPVGFLELFGRHDLERFGPNGFEAVPGEPISASDYAGIHVVESPSRGLIIIDAYTDLIDSTPRVHRLFLYDGHQTSLMPGPQSYRYPLWPGVFDLPSIGKILVISGSRIFELTRERRLVEIPSPLTFREGQNISAADMPASRVGILMDGKGIFSIDEAGIVKQIRGGDGKGGVAWSFLGVIPQRNQLLFRSRTDLHLVVDRRISGAAACDGN
jgi:hypothetical protein